MESDERKEAIFQKIKQAKAVFFDHDDTLVSTIGPKWAQHKYIASKFYRKDLSDEELHLHWGKPLKQLLELLYGADEIETAMSYNLAFRHLFPKKLFEDTPKTLKRLREAGKKIGIVTSTSLESLQNDFNSLGLCREWIDYCQTQEDTVFHKPDSRVFEPALKWLAAREIQPSEAVYVGDLFTDGRAALGAGLHFIGVATGILSLEDFAKQGFLAALTLSDICSPA